MRDLKSNIQIVHLGSITLSGTTPGASAWVDMRGFDSAAIVLHTNTVTDAGDSAGFTFTAQHSDLTTAASAAAVVAADTTDGTISLTVTSDADDNKCIGAVGYRGSKRYLRLNGVGTTGTNAVVTVYCIVSHDAQAPATFVGTSVAAT
jgi:hypothetical protein